MNWDCFIQCVRKTYYIYKNVITLITKKVRFKFVMALGMSMSSALREQDQAIKTSNYHKRIQNDLYPCDRQNKS